MSGLARLRCLLGGASACVSGGGPPIPLNPVRFLLGERVYVTDTMADGQGGLARVATVRRRLADQGPVIFVLAGDLLSPSLLSKYFNGRPDGRGARFGARLDYATFGNHEFELPVDTLNARIAESKFKMDLMCSRIRSASVRSRRSRTAPQPATRQGPAGRALHQRRQRRVGGAQPDRRRVHRHPQRRVVPVHAQEWAPCRRPRGGRPGRPRLPRTQRSRVHGRLRRRWPADGDPRTRQRREHLPDARVAPTSAVCSVLVRAYAVWASAAMRASTPQGRGACFGSGVHCRPPIAGLHDVTKRKVASVRDRWMSVISTPRLARPRPCGG